MRIPFADLLDNTLSILEECTAEGDAVSFVLQMEKAMFEKGLVTPEKDVHGLLSLESAILDIGSSPSVVQAVFYMVPIYYEGKLYIR